MQACSRRQPITAVLTSTCSEEPWIPAFAEEYSMADQQDVEQQATETAFALHWRGQYDASLHIMLALQDGNTQKLHEILQKMRQSSSPSEDETPADKTAFRSFSSVQETPEDKTFRPGKRSSQAQLPTQSGQIFRTKSFSLSC